MNEPQVCDGCWQIGRCLDIYRCKCSCSDPRLPWSHVDGPFFDPDVIVLDESVVY